jgi:crotonobetainyl-CoA:carnitine CoA-transferase CaiB-like acyl-CoA transferase
MPGPLDGITVVELSHEHVAFAGKLLADLGAVVTVVEPPGGSPQRTYEPFLDDEPGPERSLWWWHYNTSKRGVVIDPTTGGDELARLVDGADVVLIGGETFGLDPAALAAGDPALIVVAITPFGLGSPRTDEPVTDLTLLAEGGPAWSCGYDDHALPPVRGGGNQGFHTAGNWAMMSTLVALLAKQETGAGQLIDVNMLAASNVTTEMATYGWLMAGAEVQRQTGRHAAPILTPPTQVRCRDGKYATTGVPPRDPATFQAILDVLDRRGLRDEFHSSPVLEIGATLDAPINFGHAATDPMVAELMTTGRDVVWFLAEHLDAYDFFMETQTIGLATGIIYTPGELMADPHFVDRGFPTEVEHPELGRTITYPGAPYRFTATPWRATRAPLLAEHQADLA